MYGFRKAEPVRVIIVRPIPGFVLSTRLDDGLSVSPSISSQRAVMSTGGFVRRPN